jgi:hypothetical protein
MQNVVKRRFAAWLCLGLAYALTPVAAAAGSDAPRWVPALAVFDVVVERQTEPAGEDANRPRASEGDRRTLAVVAADELIAPTLPEGETEHGVPPDAIVEGAILENASGDVVVAIPVLVARADQETPAPAPSADAPPGAADGEPAAKDEAERWVPSFSLFSGVLVQNAEGDLASSRILGECADPPPGTRPPDPAHCEQQVRPTAPPSDVPLPSVTISGDDRMVTPFVGGSLELMTPGLTYIPGRPRLFVHGDAAASFSATRDVAKEGVPDTFAVTEGVDFAKESTVLGQGSTTSAEVMPLVISAGAGVAFTLEAWERRIRIKPSVEYVREEIEVEGVVKRVVQTRYRPSPRAEDFPDGFRRIELSGREKQVFHGVGPGLEVEMDTLRAGPFMLAVYLAGTAHRFLGDLEVEFSDTNEDGESADWHFEKNDWAFRGFVGLRFRWVPE